MASNGGRGAAGGAGARSRNVLIAGARGRGRARATGPRAGLSAVGRRAFGRGPGDLGACWARVVAAGCREATQPTCGIGCRTGLIPPTFAGTPEPRPGWQGLYGPWVYTDPVSGEFPEGLVSLGPRVLTNPGNPTGAWLGRAPQPRGLH